MAHFFATALGQAVGMFGYLVFEQVLGKTKYGGTLGLVAAVLKRILQAAWNGIVKRSLRASEKGN